MVNILALLSISQVVGTSFFQSQAINGTKPFHLWIFANAELLPLLPALIIVGGLIILTLSYVSWRKYKGEAQNQKRNRDKTVD